MNQKLIQLYCAMQARMAADREEGATAVEYGLMVALIAGAVILTVTALGLRLDAIFDDVLQGIGG